MQQPDSSADFDVFISYASADRSAAEQLRNALVHEGLRPWAAFTDIAGGARYAAEIVRAIGRCRTLLVLVTSASMRSEHVFREVAEAAGRQRRILPVYLEAEVDLPPQMRYYIRGLHRLKVNTGTLAAEVPRIAAGIRHFERWQDVADAPSVVERITASPRRIWAGLFCVALAAGLVIWGLQVLWRVQQQQAEQARQDALPDALAFVQLGSATREPAAAGAASNGWLLRANVVLAVADARFADVQLKISIHDNSSNATDVVDISDALQHTQVGGGQMLFLALPRVGDRLTTCITLKHPRSGERWRVTEVFTADPTASATQRSYTRSEPGRAAKDDSSSCGGGAARSPPQSP